MTIKDLISSKDYDYIEWRVTLPEKHGGEDTFFGSCKSRNGVLYPLDGDIYSEDEEILRWEEWSDATTNVRNGLTVVIKGNWI